MDLLGEIQKDAIPLLVFIPIVMTVLDWPLPL